MFPGAAPFSLILVLVATPVVVRRLVRGRMRNQSMTEEHPRLQRFWGRLTFGVLLLVIGTTVALYSDAYASSRAAGVAALCLIVGAASLVPATWPRIAANRSARAYADETGIEPMARRPVDPEPPAGGEGDSRPHHYYVFSEATGRYVSERLDSEPSRTD